MYRRDTNTNAYQYLYSRAGIFIGIFFGYIQIHSFFLLKQRPFVLIRRTSCNYTYKLKYGNLLDDKRTGKIVSFFAQLKSHKIYLPNRTLVVRFVFFLHFYSTNFLTRKKMMKLLEFVAMTNNNQI